MLAAWLIRAIRGYRRVARRIPHRRACLFAVSCSRHAELVAREQGFHAAMRAVRARLAACRPGYSFEYVGVRWTVRCTDGSAIADEDASPAVHDEAAACRAVLPAAR